MNAFLVKKMRIAFPGEPAKTPKLPPNQLNYYKWIKNHLKRLNDELRISKQEVKDEFKQQYDKRHKVKLPEYKIGQRVLLFDRRVKPHSDNVLTLRPYSHGPFIIVDLVKGQDDIGTAYKLTHCDSEKPYRRLVSADRLKPYLDRKEVHKRLPLLAPRRTVPDEDNKKKADSKTDDAATTDIPKDCELAKRVLKEGVKNGQPQYLVLFLDGSRFWCDFITDPILQSWRITQQRRRTRKRKS